MGICCSNAEAQKQAGDGRRRMGRSSSNGEVMGSDLNSTGLITLQTLPNAKGEINVNKKGVVLLPGAFLFEVSISSICTRNLKAMDLLSSDPFVRFHWGDDSVYETQYFRKARKKARFPETFSFVCASTLKGLSEKKVLVEVLDWNSNGKHATIGTTEVSFKQVACGPIHHDHELMSAEGMASGRVSFNCTMQATDSWKISLKGVQAIYKPSFLQDSNQNGLPFRLQYCYIDYMSRSQNPTKALHFADAKRTFGSLSVVTWSDEQLPPLRWGGSFLKFISGSLKFELFGVVTDDNVSNRLDPHERDLNFTEAAPWYNPPGGGEEVQPAEAKASQQADNRISFATLANLMNRNKVSSRNSEPRTTYKHNDILNENVSGTLWLSLKRLYSMSEEVKQSEGDQSQRSLTSSKAAKSGESKQADNHSMMAGLRKTLSNPLNSYGSIVGKKSGQGSLTLSSASSNTTSSIDAASTKNTNSPYTRRVSEFENDLWLDGKKIGTILGTIVFERVPPVGQMASGVITENGIAVASPVIVGEKRGGTIFRLISSKIELPDAVVKIGKIFGKLVNMDMRKKTAYKNQRRIMRRILRMLRHTDKYSMLSWVYSDANGLLSTQKLLLTIGNWFMDRIEAIETPYETMQVSYVGIFLVMSRGELSDLSTLGFDPMNLVRAEENYNLEKWGANMPESASNHLKTIPFGVSPEQLDMIILIRKLLVRCLAYSVSRVRFKTEDPGELRFCAKIFALCSFRIPEFGTCMAHAVLPSDDTYRPIAAWQNDRGVSLSDLSAREAIAIDNGFESYFYSNNFPPEWSKNYGLSLKHTKVGNPHKYGRLDDPATMMMDWRQVSLILRQHRSEAVNAQNELLPGSCLDPELVDEITKDAASREVSRRSAYVDGDYEDRARSSSAGKKIRLRTKSVLTGLRAAPVDVELKIEDFPSMDAYRKASRLQQELILEQAWVLRMRNRKYLFLLFSQEWIQEVIDVVALVQNTIQWYHVPWYSHLLKAILLEMQDQDVRSYSESLVLLSRALILNADVISPFVKSVTATTQARSLGDVTLGLAMIRSWFVAMSSWHLRKARGVYTLSSLNRRSLPADFQYDYLSLIILKLFDNTLPFQITQKGLEFLYSVWDVIPSEYAERIRKKLLVSGAFLDLFLHWESNVRRFFVYLLAVRLFLPRRWCHGGGMPSVHFKDFVEDNSVQDRGLQIKNASDDESSDDESSDDDINVHTFASSSSSLDVTASVDNVYATTPSPYGAGDSLESSSKTSIELSSGSSPIHLRKGDFVASAATPPKLFLPVPDESIGAERFSVSHHPGKELIHRSEPGTVPTPTSAGNKHPKGSRILMISERTREDLMTEIRGHSPRNTSPRNTFTTHKPTNITISKKNGSIPDYKKSVSEVSDAYSNLSGTEAMARMASLIRILRRMVIDYSDQREIDWMLKAEQESLNKDTELLEATTRPGDNFKLSSSVDELRYEMYRARIEELERDEMEYGSSSRSNKNFLASTANPINLSNPNKSWADEFGPGRNPNVPLHPLPGGECQEFLLDPKCKESDENLLQSGVLWETISLPGQHRLAYAKDSLRMYTLAARRVHDLLCRIKEIEVNQGLNDDRMALTKMVKVPELTFIALVKGEKGMYKNASHATKDSQPVLN